MEQEILRNRFINIPHVRDFNADPASIGTILSNLASYGYTLDKKAYDSLCSCADLTAWWQEVEPVLKRITGADRNMGRFVVYKNFPREVLEMTETELILKQVLIYLGVSQDVLTEEEQERPPLGDMTKLKVLSCDAPGNLLSKLMAAPYRWSDNQMEWARSLTKEVDGINLSEFAFKENGVRLAIAHFDDHGLGKVTASSATDVLRLAAGMSGCDISLREKVWFRKFKRAERRYFLSILDTMPNLVEDMGARPRCGSASCSACIPVIMAGRMSARRMTVSTRVRRSRSVPISSGRPATCWRPLRRGRVSTCGVSTGSTAPSVRRQSDGFCRSCRS